MAREQAGHRILIVGFNPQDSNFPLESAFPLMMAGSVEWMTHSVDEVADSLSTGEVDIPGPATKIIAPSGREVPFARKGANLHLLALETGTYRIVGPGGENNIAINPPALPAQRAQLTAAETAQVEGEPLPPPVANVAISYRRPGDALARATVINVSPVESETRCRWK